jgi:hypothetical protein
VAPVRVRERSDEVIRPLRRVLRLLQRLQPARTEGDILWRGPFFIPRPGEWWPTQFLRYRNELHCTVELGWSALTLVWEMERNHIRFENEPSWGGPYLNGTGLWNRVLGQVERRLVQVIESPAAYNRRVARLLPLRCRAGRIKRRLTWPRRSSLPMTASEMASFESALEQGARAESWRSLTVRRYLETTAVAYDAVFPELRSLTPRKKYERKADTRHGGLLDLKPTDPRAFEVWYQGRDWLGAHPWEIVFAHPHGILLSPHRAAGTWRFFLSVDTLGLYRDAARMAIALGAAGVPFELARAAEVIAALRGEDWVEVGPFRGQLALEELEERRPGATSRVVWDDPPRLLPLERRPLRPSLRR